MVSINKILKEIHSSSSIVLTILKFINYIKDMCLIYSVAEQNTESPPLPPRSAGLECWLPHVMGA